MMEQARGENPVIHCQQFLDPNQVWTKQVWTLIFKVF